MTEPVITIRNLEKNFGNLKVLRDINLDIYQSDIIGLIGRSGAGKSTLLRCINGLTDYNKGKLSVFGQDISLLTEKELAELRKNIGMIFQTFSLVSRKTVFENIALPMKFWNYNRKKIKHRVHELAELVNISDKLDSYPRELSGGQKQRVGIARSLSLNPKILLSDEATSALDPITTESILSLLKRIHQELDVTIVVVTHEIDVVKSICNRTAILEHGEIAQLGITREIFIEESEALRRLSPINREIHLGANNQLLKIKFINYENYGELLYDLSQKSLKFKVIDFNIQQYLEKRSGYVLLEVSKEQIGFFKDYLKSVGLDGELFYG